MLELVRLGSIHIKQGQIFGEILIHTHEKEIDEATFALFDNS
jgi:chromatin segregation and condensation protein Rec8/ScpA/Scc1 (kleisin family)